MQIDFGRRRSSSFEEGHSFGSRSPSSSFVPIIIIISGGGGGGGNRDFVSSLLTVWARQSLAVQADKLVDGIGHHHHYHLMAALEVRDHLKCVFDDDSGGLAWPASCRPGHCTQLPN
ncbi:MAG: hypothetical protein QWI73_04985 [Alphaproteobacteria bacterium]|nr:hypothetical protein [Alphaproteobacteria bacterium]